MFDRRGFIARVLAAIGLSFKKSKQEPEHVSFDMKRCRWYRRNSFRLAPELRSKLIEDSQRGGDELAPIVFPATEFSVPIFYSEMFPMTHTIEIHRNP